MVHWTVFSYYTFYARHPNIIGLNAIVYSNISVLKCVHDANWVNNMTANDNFHDVSDGALRRLRRRTKRRRRRHDDTRRLIMFYICILFVQCMFRLWSRFTTNILPFNVSVLLRSQIWISFERRKKKKKRRFYLKSFEFWWSFVLSVRQMAHNFATLFNQCHLTSHFNFLFTYSKYDKITNNCVYQFNSWSFGQSIITIQTVGCFIRVAI